MKKIILKIGKCIFSAIFFVFDLKKVQSIFQIDFLYLYIF